MATKKTPDKKAAQEPVKEPVKEPLIRVAFTATDFRRLLDHVDGWEDPVSHKLRLVYSRFRMKHPT